MSSDMHPLGLEPRTYSHAITPIGAERVHTAILSGENGHAQHPKHARKSAQRGDEGVTLVRTAVLIYGGTAA